MQRRDESAMTKLASSLNNHFFIIIWNDQENEIITELNIQKINLKKNTSTLYCTSLLSKNCHSTKFSKFLF